MVSMPRRTPDNALLSVSEGAALVDGTRVRTRFAPVLGGGRVYDSRVPTEARRSRDASLKWCGGQPLGAAAAP